MLKFNRRWGYAPNGNHVVYFEADDTADQEKLPEPWYSSAINSGAAQEMSNKSAPKNKSAKPPKNKGAK